MTTQTLIFNVATGCADASSLTWTATVSDDCFSLDQSTGTINGTSGTVTLIASASDSDCLDGETVTLTVVDDLGNSSSYPQTLSDPCIGVALTVAQQTVGEYAHSFVAAASGGDGQYTYNWSFDTDVFEPVSNLDTNVLSLKLAKVAPSGGFPSQTTVYCTIKDGNNCEVTVSTIDYLCRPAAQDLNVTMSCYPSEQTVTDCGTVKASNNKKKIFATPCSGRNIDWSTFTWESSDGLCLTTPTAVAEGDTDREVNIYALSTATAGAGTITWSVKDTDGVESNTATIYVIIPDCAAVDVITPPIVIEDQLYELSSSELTPATEIEIDIDDFNSGKIHVQDQTTQRLDWSSFTFIDSTGQTLLTATTMTGLNGDIELTLDHKIKFTVGAVLSCNLELIRFRISDGLGNVSNEGRVILDFEPSTAPTAVADSGNCVVCGENVEIDILANDTGTINPGSVQITDEPTLGTYSVASSDGKLTYAANPNNEGADTLDYKVANPDGRYSNEVTVSITVICAGEDNSDNEICLVAGVDLTSYLSSWATAGGTWSANLGNPTAVGLGTPTSVDFSAATAGDYEFYYEVTSGSCSQTATINITAVAASGNDECAGAAVMTYPAVAGATEYFDDQTILECDTVSDVSTLFPTGTLQIPPNWDRLHSGDVWFKFTTGASLLTPKLFVDSSAYSDALNHPQIAIYSGSCGVDTFTLVSSAAIGNNGKYVELEPGALSASTEYHVRVSGGGATNTGGQFQIGIHHA